MRSALLYRYGDIAYWTGNYAEGGSDLVEAVALSAEAQSPTYHIRPAELTAERRADVDKSLEGYARLNNKYGYRTQEQAYSGDKPIFMKECRQPRRTLFRKIHDFFVEEVYE
jgi:hypothetical protein